MKPANWLFKDPSSAQRGQMCQYGSEYDQLFRDGRRNWLEERMANVVREQRKSNDDFIDPVDDIIHIKQRSNVEKKCVHCGAPNEIAARLCTNCKGHLIKSIPNIAPVLEKMKPVDPYSHLHGIVATFENDIIVVTGEPELLNPNSYEAVAQILRSMGQKAGITRYGGTVREWIFMECDGGIYVLAEKLIFNVFLCGTCNESFY